MSGPAEQIIAHAREAIASSAASLTACEPLIRLGCDVAAGIDGADTRWDSGGSNLWVTMYATRVEQLADTRRLFAAAGFRLVSVHEYPEHHYQTHRLRHPDLRGDVILDFQFLGATSVDSDPAAVCTYVQVGVKETPVFELRCAGAKAGA